MPSAPSAAAVGAEAVLLQSLLHHCETSVGESSTIRTSAMVLYSRQSRLTCVSIARQEFLAREGLRQVVLGADDAAAGAVEEAVLEDSMITGVERNTLLCLISEQV